MTNANYTTTATPQLKISCHADLQITGAPDNIVVIDIDDNSPASHIERQGDVILITAVRDCDITCPIGSALTIEHASGDLRVLQVKGALAVNAVNGDAVLHDVGPAAIKTVQGDLSLRDASGDVQIEIVRGDAKIKRVTGNVAINKVAGDLVANDLGGRLAVSNVGGDASLQTSLAAGQSYVVKTGGDLIFARRWRRRPVRPELQRRSARASAHDQLDRQRTSGHRHVWRWLGASHADGEWRFAGAAGHDRRVIVRSRCVVRASGSDDRIGHEPVRIADVASAA